MFVICIIIFWTTLFAYGATRLANYVYRVVSNDKYEKKKEACDFNLEDAYRCGTVTSNSLSNRLSILIRFDWPIRFLGVNGTLWR